MPIIKSAKKRAKTSRKATIRNSKTKRSLKSALKTFSAKPTLENSAKASSHIDKAVKKGVVHKNKAARLKKRAAAEAKANGLKITKSPKKSTPKAKPAAKKSTAKKK